MTTEAVTPAPVLAVTTMARRLTTPFARGADTLSLRLRLSTSSQAAVDSYDFTDHEARFGVPPEPAYVLTTTRDIDVDTTVTLTYQEPGARAVDRQLTVPAGTVTGTSFLLEQPRTATARLTLLTMVPTPSDNSPQDCWTLTALLGTTAKLLWVTGAERDQLRRHAATTLAQRHLPSALGLSLDLIGADLGVPRFPALPYGFDPDTVALYHLDDDAGATPQVADTTAAYPGRTAHHGVLQGPVQTGLPGRYGRAMGFRSADAAVVVATDATFDIGERDDATFECFVRPDPAPDPDGPVLSRRTDPEIPGPGWEFAVGDFGRGLARNVRFTIGDGDPDHDVTLFADTTLPTDAFTHVAAVLDRTSDKVGLYLDGRLRDWRFLFPLGAVAGPAPLRIGAAGGGFRGVVDEVRISSAARTDFAPALGEGDDHYRRRLELFRRWTLPTPANLTALLNRLAGPIGGHPDALVVDDTNATLARGTRLVHIRPYALLPGESIDATGRRRTTEASAVGTAAQEDTFDPAYLLRYDHAGVDFTPAQAPADPHLVQVGVSECLDRLVTLAGAETAPPGRLLVAAAYDPLAGDLRATGRAVLLGHSSVPLGRLAALAHRAGFDYVAYRAGAGEVYAAIALGDYFRIDVTPIDVISTAVGPSAVGSAGVGSIAGASGDAVAADAGLAEAASAGDTPTALDPGSVGSAGAHSTVSGPADAAPADAASIDATEADSAPTPAASTGVAPAVGASTDAAMTNAAPTGAAATSAESPLAGATPVGATPTGATSAAVAPADPTPTAATPNSAAPVDLAPTATTPPNPNPTDLDQGAAVTLSLRPAPPADAFLNWLVVPGGSGRAVLTPESGAGSRHRTAALAATAAGQLIVKADAARGRHTVSASATRDLRVGLAGLDDGASIAADGTPGVPASSVERPGTYFDAAFLVRHDDPRVDYGSDAAHLVQLAVAELLDALLAELDRRSVAGRLTVTAAFDDTGDPPDPAAAQGRRLGLRHSSLDAGALAGVAFAVGFGYLLRSGDELEVRQAPGQLVSVRGPAGVEQGAVIELDEGATMDLTANPSPAALAAAGLIGQFPGEGPRLGWASGTFDTAAITVASSTQQTVTLRADAAGMAWVQASYLIDGRAVPYTFQVRLRPELDTPTTVITKDQHDLIMNILNVLHPVGVEVNTAAIRAHVVELQGDLSHANPDYTYPRFRARGPLPPRARRPADG
ncbi:LamG-like jellyroll fold domain-containing protein [Streptomyces xylophagus]|uniref:LamG-like jellyroll fold domain-containing protein n=1 Tax=Streptomyces xylophagus TaxID=285514 RepID=UPI0005BA6B9E|nr:LamG-like jellyroll fold domain-containing protein [Streptomyces xylophagus]